MDEKAILNKKIKQLRENGYSEKEATNIQNSIKRQRAEEDAVPGGKNPKLDTYASVTRQFELIITHKDHPIVVLDEASLTELIKALHEVLDLETTRVVQFSRLNIDINRIRITCKDLTSKDWILEKVPLIDTNKILKVFDLNGLPKMRYVSLKFIDHGIVQDKIIARIKRQNPELNVNFWNVMEDKIHPDGDRVIVLQIDKDSLEKINKNRMKVYCGFNEMYVKRIHNFVKQEAPDITGLNLDEISFADESHNNDNDSDEN